mmetsp:Transcript_86101/g.240761  ORF Transcript_86101/g.240761 Transcript_86101/m.240761 type:complete len:423 (-) Transcript_86101:967-2235(-)
MRSEYNANNPAGNFDKCCVKVSNDGTNSGLSIRRMHKRSVLTMSRSMNCLSLPPPPFNTYCKSRSKCVLTSGQICDTLWPSPSGMHVIFVSSSSPKTGSATSCHSATAATLPMLAPPGETAEAVSSEVVADAPDDWLVGADQLPGRDKRTSDLARICRLSADKREIPVAVNISTNPDFATYCFTCEWTTCGSDDTTGKESPLSSSPSPAPAAATPRTPADGAEPPRKPSPVNESRPYERASPSSSSSSVSSRVSSSNHCVKLSRKLSRGCLGSSGSLPNSLFWRFVGVDSLGGSSVGVEKGGRKSHRLSNGLPSGPVKSSNSVRCGGNSPQAQSCNRTSNTVRHSFSWKCCTCCATHCCAAESAIWARIDKAPAAEAREKYWHITRTKLFTASTWPKYALIVAKSWKPTVTCDATDVSFTDS